MKKLENILTAISIVIFIWLFISFIDVNIHSLNGGCDTWWNAFVIFTNLF